MPAAASKANYKSYEAQARMVRAIVAAHPEVKWNYKEIAQSFGSDMTEDALNHRFRILRAEAVIIREGRARGFDMKRLGIDDLPRTQGAVDKKNIAKYFGQSTADGIQFQFRTIKKDADTLRKVEATGGDVANCLPSIGTGGSSVTNTPSKPAPYKATPGRSGGAGSKRVRKTFSKPIDSDLDDDGAEPDSPENWSDREETPSKRAKTGAAPGQKHGTPTRRAATKATVTIADASAQLLSGDSHSEAETPSSSAPLGRSVGSATPATAPVPAHQSIFGHIEVKPDRRLIDAAFSRNGTDPYIGGDGLADDLIYGVNLPLDEDFYDEAEV